ncbi:MAG: hypothetical protein R6U27_03270 [Desulfobacterales bacterium]
MEYLKIKMPLVHAKQPERQIRSARVTPEAVRRLRRIKANNTPAAVIVGYGNRELTFRSFFYIDLNLMAMIGLDNLKQSCHDHHKTVIGQATGWQIGEKDATDDRLAILAQALGENDEAIYKFQTLAGQSIISAYQLPLQIARYDTTSFKVCHHPENTKNGILQFGHSKDFRPDLLQFKQGLGTLGPGGIPLLSETFAGNCPTSRLKAKKQLICFE